MSTITNNPILSNAKQVRYGAIWSSVYDMLKPQIWQELVKYYGGGVGLAEFAHIMGATVNIAGPTKIVYEEGSPYKLVTLGIGGIAIAGEGVDITFTLDAAEYDTSNKAYLAVRDMVVIPAYYLEEDGTKSVKPENYQVTSINGVGVAAIYTATPHKSNIAVVEPLLAGVELMVTGGLVANETSVGVPKASGWYSRTFHCSTIRTPWAQGGSTQSNQRYYEELKGGGTGIFSKNTAEADMRHTKTMSDQMWIGSGVTNTFTMLNRDNDAIDVTGTVGVLEHLVDRAMPQYYTAAYDKPCFEDIKAALQSQGVLDRNVTFFFGSELGRQIENLNLDFIKEFSGGTDFMKTMGSIDSTFKAVKYNGVNVSFKELSVLSDPIAYGADAFDDSFRSLGFILPDVDVNVRGSLESLETVKLKNLTLGLKDYNGEDRSRLVSVTNGLGSQATDLWDDRRGDILSEFMVIFNKVNQAILIQDDRILVSP